jgi:hypothetical protein
MTDLLRDHCTRLVRAIAPDLADAPVYIIFRSELPRELAGEIGTDLRIAGLTCPALDVLLRDYLAERWAGRGAAMIINDADLIEEERERRRRFNWTEAEFHEAVRSAVAAVVVHETAHILDDGLPTRELSPESLDTGAAMLREELSGTVDYADHDLPFRGHEWAFIRTLLHLEHRAQAAGFALNGWHLFTGSSYGTRSLIAYGTALGDEPQEMAAKTFAEIGATLPPAEFYKCWIDDVTRYLTRTTDREAAELAIAKCARRIFILGDL